MASLFRGINGMKKGLDRIEGFPEFPQHSVAAFKPIWLPLELGGGRLTGLRRMVQHPCDLFQ